SIRLPPSLSSHTHTRQLFKVPTPGTARVPEAALHRTTQPTRPPPFPPWLKHRPTAVFATWREEVEALQRRPTIRKTDCSLAGTS
ncbi:unnamed protein product, partial [Ectocarpus fasciculatus]